jgi:hypothetical protein
MGMTRRVSSVVGVVWLSMTLPASAVAQVHYDPASGSPWNQRASEGPDAQVPGWYYNLGVTGMRAELVANEPTTLLVRYVFPGSVAAGQIEAGDVIVGAGGKSFQTPHRNGYGEEVFGGYGPIMDFADALEGCQSKKADGKLKLSVRRNGKVKEVTLSVGKTYGSYAPTFPAKCPKSEKILAELLAMLAQNQNEDGSFGEIIADFYAPLALLASGEPRYLPAVTRVVENISKQAQNDHSRDALINWHYMSWAIITSEYYLATGDKRVLSTIQTIHDSIAKSQYLNMSQINPQAKESHPDSFPKGPRDSHGGWGHNPGFEGYGPIAMITGQGALAYALMHRCGIKVDRAKHDAAYDFLHRGTGANGYVWYGDSPGGGPDSWADMGRTGATAIANMLSPYPEPIYRQRALLHARVMGMHPQSFPDTHGSPMMGMVYQAIGSNVDQQCFRSVMDANRWWFTMAHCPDGTFSYQPNRDNAGYGNGNRAMASAVVALIYSIPKQSLVITGKQPPKPAGKTLPKPAGKGTAKPAAKAPEPPIDAVPAPGTLYLKSE